MRQRHVAGEKTFVDWAGPTIPWIDPETGEVRKAYLFVAALGASNLTFARAYPNLELAPWIDGHVRTFEFIGGTTRAVVPDNTRTAVSNANYYEPELHPTYQEMAEHYGVVILPSRVGRPRDKAKVENAVLQAERQILAPLRDQKFFSVGEINAAIGKLLAELNDRPFQKVAGSRRSWFEDLDRPALRPLPPEPYELAEWRKAIVNLDYHVQVDWRFYSVPYRLVKRQVDVKLTAAAIQIFLKGKRVALHARVQARGAYSTDPAHMPKAHLRYGQRTPRQLLERARAIGPACAQVAASIIEERPHPEQGYRSVLGILRLGRDLGDERLERACRRAQLYDCRSYRSIASILKAGLDREPLTQDAGSPAATGHPNIRGRAYFQASLPLELAEVGDDDVNGALERSKSHA
jgi:transposase